MEIECRFDLSPIMEKEWNEFLRNSQHAHPRQYLPFAEEERARGRTPLYVFGRKNSKTRAIALISLKPHPFIPSFWTSALCQSGPVCENIEDLATFLKNFLLHPIASKIGRMHITPYWFNHDAVKMDARLKLQGWSTGETDPFRSTGIIGLADFNDELFANMTKSARREVRRAERQEVEFRPAGSLNEAMIFLNSLNRLYSSRSLPNIDESGFIAAYHSVFQHQDLGALILAWKNEEFLAGIMVIRSHKTVHGSQFTNEPGSLKKYGNLRIAPSIWLEAAKWGRSKGCTFLDLEGYKTPKAGDPKFNINKYKSELGPEEVIRVPELNLTINRFCHITGNTRSILKNQLSKLRSFNVRIV